MLSLIIAYVTQALCVLMQWENGTEEGSYMISMF